MSEIELINIKSHPIFCELENLTIKKYCTLPYFINEQVIWSTLAWDSMILKNLVNELHDWILPSFGWEADEDGYKIPVPEGSRFQKAIYGVSPLSYYRWRCNYKDYPIVLNKLLVKNSLESKRPERQRYSKLSLYELRTQFQTALTLGDRIAARHCIASIDEHQLDSAHNTNMMLITLFYHFREFDKIKEIQSIHNLLDQSLPKLIFSYIHEAINDSNSEAIASSEAINIIDDVGVINWDNWFDSLINYKDIDRCTQWLVDKNTVLVKNLNIDQINMYAKYWDEIFINDELKEKYKIIIIQAMSAFLSDFVREEEFPRHGFETIYLSLLRIWGDFFAGSNTGREHSLVILELANALFALNHEVDQTKDILEEWWKKRAVTSQLPYVLDAIELLMYQHPNQEAPTNLWISAADLAKKYSHNILESEKILWRSAGTKIGLDEDDIQEYFPINVTTKVIDPLKKFKLKNVAIVCMREQQAREAARIIEERTGANITLVTTKVADKTTNKACTCDVVLFVWIATTHAVFRAFDKYNRKNLCYVQGTGATSVVRSLERWVVNR